MAEKDLIQIQTLPPERRLEMQRRGGYANKGNPKHAMAVKIGLMKGRARRGQLKTKDAKWLVERLTDPGAFAADLLSLFDIVKTNIDKNPNATSILSAGTNLYKAIHGERHKVEKVNVNINLDEPLNQEEKSKLLDFINNEK